MNEVNASVVRRRRPWRLALVGLVSLAVLGASGYAWYRWGPGAKTESAYITATVQRGDIEDQVSATGSLQPRDYVDVGAQVSGQLRKIHVEVGSEVQAGDLLAEIEAETSQARVDASRAQLRSQQAQMVERELTLAKAERDLQRQKNLMAEEATTTETLQNAETAVKTARVQIQSLKASMEQLQASMRVEEANLKFTKIYAPMAGTVVSITARQGQTLNTNQSAPTLLRIADLSVMTVQTQVSEADVSKLRGGMPVYFTTLGGQGRRWYGELKKIEPTPTVTNNVVLYNALFEVPNQNRSLMTQMTAQVFFVVAEAKDVLVVPMSALTIQRGPQGSRTGQGGGGSRGPGATEQTPPSAPAASSPASRGTNTSSVPGAGFRQVADASATAAGAAGERPRMSREAFQNMTEEERARLREQRRKERELAQAAAPAAATPTPSASTPGANPKRPAVPANASTAPAAGKDASARPAPVSSGIPRSDAFSRAARGPRQAKVKVMTEDGTIEERDITIGISNRVHAEVLSGLKEGDRVIAGVREPDTARSNAAQQGAGVGQQRVGGPGGMPAGVRR
ncbi:MAG: efflux RND transporter periplasmic adaptor subunit [Hydrogenophaga sp.]|uniref:efflux RND transporter periplasmic adaptor subunit n=1 Tax=Hydrogenophaga sp. TaxID=1904254 RepID=UPI003D0D5D9E